MSLDYASETVELHQSWATLLSVSTHGEFLAVLEALMCTLASDLSAHGFRSLLACKFELNFELFLSFVFILMTLINFIKY